MDIKLNFANLFSFYKARIRDLKSLSDCSYLNAKIVSSFKYNNKKISLIFLVYKYIRSLPNVIFLYCIINPRKDPSSTKNVPARELLKIANKIKNSSTRDYFLLKTRWAKELNKNIIRKTFYYCFNLNLSNSQLSNLCNHGNITQILYQMSKMVYSLPSIFKDTPIDLIVDIFVSSKSEPYLINDCQLSNMPSDNENLNLLDIESVIHPTRNKMLANKWIANYNKVLKNLFMNSFSSIFSAKHSNLTQEIEHVASTVEKLIDNLHIYERKFDI